MHRVCAGKLQVHAVEKVLFVALGMHHLEFWGIEETAGVQRVRGDEIAPLRTAKRYVKATVGRAKAAVRGFHAAHRFCLAQAGTRRHLDDQTRLVTKFGGRSAGDDFPRLNRIRPELIWKEFAGLIRNWLAIHPKTALRLVA